MPEMTPEDRRISQEFFNRVDRNHDRKITLEEWLQDEKENPSGERVVSEEEARKTFNEWDMNGDGVIDEKEFWTVMMLHKRGSRPDIVKEIWGRFDQDKDGFVVKEDVLRFWDNLFGLDQIDDPNALIVLFDEFDTDHDGKLNLDEFIPFGFKLFGEP